MVKTSASDTDDYRDFCRRAADDDAVFGRFREDPIYRFVVQTELPYAGLDHWQMLSERGFDFGFFDRIRDLDALGRADTIDYEHAGAVAPQTMRYVRIMHDLELLFGGLDGRVMIEIGGGFGGQGAVIARRFPGVRYVLVDMPEPLALARRYLGAAVMTGARFAELGDLAPDARYDVAISCYAWSECERSIQQAYAERVFQRAAGGYMILNWNALRKERGWQTRTFGGEMMYTEDLMALMPAATLRPALRSGDDRLWDCQGLVGGARPEAPL